MPLSVNVGLSRKASRDYQSVGTSINVTAELDQALLAKPDELQQQVRDLYAQAEAALDRQAAHMNAPARPKAPARPARSTANGNGRSGVHRENGRNSGGDGQMTDSQRRAIFSIADRINADVDIECREIIGAEFDRLTVRQASELIDHLKGLQPARNGHYL